MYENCFENFKFVWQLPEKGFYQNSETEVHQVGPKKILIFLKTNIFEVFQQR
jgi:hypothetical protein